jgi:hypothetical protein
VCGIWISGEELRALAFPPDAEIATAKIGRLRLGDCARKGCDAWQYSLHLWDQEEVDWPALIAVVKDGGRSRGEPKTIIFPRWLDGLRSLMGDHVIRGVAMLGVVFVLWMAREVYLGGRIPFLREPEIFTREAPALEPGWPAPLD